MPIGIKDTSGCHSCSLSSTLEYSLPHDDRQLANDGASDSAGVESKRNRQMIRNKFKFAALGLALLLPAIAPTGYAPVAQTAPPRSAGKNRIPKPPPEPPEVAMPFRAGEKLDYRISWATFSSAADLELTVPERRDLYGWHTWHFQAVSHTLKSVRTLFAIDDQFDSYTDSASLECRQFESYLNELGKNYTNVLHLIPQGSSPHAPGAAVVVLPGTRDPLGMLFTLRAADWQHNPEARMPVYDGQTLYEMRARAEALIDQEKVDAGSFNTTRVGVSVFRNQKEDPAIHFTIWFANDAARVPVLIAAQLPFGSLRVELTSATAGRATH
jgi:hypothetical protein